MGPRIRLGVLVALVLVAAACSDAGGAEDMPEQAIPDTTASSLAISVTGDLAFAGHHQLEPAAGQSSDPQRGVRGPETWELDVYAPEDGAGLPVIVLMHGLSASKASHVQDSESMAGLGAVVFAIDAPVTGLFGMTLDNGRKFREVSEVLACAVGYAQATAEGFGGNPDHIVLVAHSFGALYGAWFALGSDEIAARWSEYAIDHDGPPMQVDCETAPSTSLAGFVGVGGGRYAEVEQGDFPEEHPHLRDVVNPYTYLGQNPALPIRLLHGENDSTAPTESSRAFNELLLDAGHDSELTLFDDGHIVPPELTYQTVAQLTSP